MAIADWLLTVLAVVAGVLIARVLLILPLRRWARSLAERIPEDQDVL